MRQPPFSLESLWESVFHYSAKVIYSFFTYPSVVVPSVVIKIRKRKTPSLKIEGGVEDVHLIRYAAEIMLRLPDVLPVQERLQQAGC